MQERDAGTLAESACKGEQGYGYAYIYIYVYIYTYLNIHLHLKPPIPSGVYFSYFEIEPLRSRVG